MEVQRTLKKLLIDGDILLFKFALTNAGFIDWGEGVTSEYADLKTAQEELDGYIQTLYSMTDTQEEGSYLCFSSYPDYVSDNFRYKVYPDYKHNRKGKDKPKLYWDLRDYLLQNYDTKIKSTLEADDVLGIMSTLHPGEFIIVTSDKDLKQIPGEHFNPDTMELFDVTPEQGDYWFYKQILTGDATDGYPGCKGIGPKKADTFLESTFREYRENGNIPKWFIWKYGIKPTYESKGLTEDFALSQARVARILRAEDYDFKKKQVKLWTP